MDKRDYVLEEAIDIISPMRSLVTFSRTTACLVALNSGCDIIGYGLRLWRFLLLLLPLLLGSLVPLPRQNVAATDSFCGSR